MGLSSRSLQETLAVGVQWLYVEDILEQGEVTPVEEPLADGSSLAYIMYTSGSTGRPKGIVVNQQSMWGLVHNRRMVGVRPSDAVLQWSNYGFDGSVFDIFCTLLQGDGRLYPTVLKILLLTGWHMAVLAIKYFRVSATVRCI